MPRELLQRPIQQFLVILEHFGVIETENDGVDVEVIRLFEFLGRIAGRPGKPLMGSLYLNSGSEGRWLAEEEFKQLTDFFIDNVNRGRLCGIRIFRIVSLEQRPEYAKRTKESPAKLKVR